MTDPAPVTSPGVPAPTPRAAWWPPALAGALALALGLAVAELVAGALGRAETPVVAVGEEFIDLTPGWLKDLAIELFGTHDKTALLVGMAVVLTVLGALTGLLTARRRVAGLAIAAALLIVAALAVWNRPDTTEADLLPTLAAGVVALPALGWLVRRSVDTHGDGDGDGYGDRDSGRQPQSRRAFLVAAAVTAGVAVAGGVLGRMLGARRLGVEQSRDDLATTVELPRPDLPDGVDLGVGGVQPWRTPSSDFYRIDTALSVPLIRAEDWSLRVRGMVETEVELGYQELVDLGLVDRWLTLNCVSNEVGGDLIGNALWTGVPIADVLALAGPVAGADAVLSRSDDGWTAGTPLDVLTDGRDALFAVAMNGEPLPVEHGFPVRMIVPGLYGYVSATKWVVELEVSRFADFEAYWTTRGWAERGPVKVASRIDVPRGGTSVDAGTVAVAGTAWAQHRGIAAVQVRVDDGDWTDARLADVPTQGGVPSTDTWRQWVWDWAAEPGEHRLQVRAVTTDGEVQTEDEAPPVPDGASGWHTVTVDVG